MKGASNTVLIAGGGTGGHLFPGLAVAKELQRRDSRREIVFVGSEKGLEQRLIPQAGYRLISLPVRGMKGRGPVAKIGALFAAGRSLLSSFGTMRRLRPALAIGVGGYASGPAVLAATWSGVRTMVLEQNHFPGATNRWLAPRVDRVCLPSEAARDRLEGLGTVTGNPVRPEFFRIGKAPGAERLSLLIFGGSRGARSINQAVARSLKSLAAKPLPPRILHQTGEADLAAALAAGEDYPDELYTAAAFIDDMPERLAAADLVVCRAGATTLAELAAAGRPAILVPYPHAADDHQRHNAEAVRDAEAAELLLDGDLEGERLADAIQPFLGATERLQRMSAAARTLAFPNALDEIASIAESLMAENGGAHVS